MVCKTHRDLEDIIAKQNDKIYHLEKEIEQLKLDKVYAVEEAKKEADEKAMLNMIKKIHIIEKLEQEIKQLKKEAQDNLLYP